MAQVPLLETGRAPRAPMPVLDTVSGGLRVRLDDVAADLMAPQMPADFGQREAAGGAAIGQAIGQAGQYLAGIGEQIQRAKNIADITEAETQMDEAFAAYQDEMANNPDEASWATNWGEQLKGLETQIIGNPKLSPAARDELSNRFMRFQGQSKISIATAARKQSIMRAKDAIELQLIRAVENQDPEAGDAALAQATDVGLMLPGEAEARSLGIRKQIERNQKIEEAEQKSALFEQLYGSTFDAPEAIAEMLLEKDGDQFKVPLTQNQRAELLGVARRREFELRDAEAEEIYNDIWSGKIGSEEEIIARAEDSRLQPKDLQQLISGLKSRQFKTPPDKATLAELRHQAEQLAELEEPDYDALYNLQSELRGINDDWTQIHRTILGDVQSRWARQGKDPGTLPEPKVSGPHASVLKALSDQYWRSGLFGNNLNADGSQNLNDFGEAAASREMWEMSMEEWSKQNPGASPLEFQKAADDALHMQQAGVSGILFDGFAPDAAAAEILQNAPAGHAEPPKLSFQTWDEAVAQLRKNYPDGNVPGDIYETYRRSWEASLLTGRFPKSKVTSLLRDVERPEQINEILFNETGGMHDAALQQWTQIWQDMQFEKMTP